MRLEMTKKTDLALKAMRCVGDAEGETIAGRVLAEKLGITTHYLPQVISPLVKAGWISSTPGPRGGYRLMTALTDISVLAVIEVIDGRTEDQGCVQRGISCTDFDPGALNDPCQKARAGLPVHLALATIHEHVGAGGGMVDRRT